MLIAELDQVVDVRRPAVDPVPDVVHVGELGVGAAGKPASLVPAPDLEPLGVARVSPGPPEVEAPAVGAVGRDQDLGVAGQPAGHLARHRPQDVELGAPVGLRPGSPCRRGRPRWAGCAERRPPGGPPRSRGRRALSSASLLQTATRASAMRWSKGVRSRRRERPARRATLLTTAYWSSGSTPVRRPPSVVEAEEAAGVDPGRPLVGLVAGGHAPARGPAWPTSASPVRPAARRSRAWPPRPGA